MPQTNLIQASVAAAQLDPAGRRGRCAGSILSVISAAADTAGDEGGERSGRPGCGRVAYGGGGGGGGLGTAGGLVGTVRRITAHVIALGTLAMLSDLKPVH